MTQLSPTDRDANIALIKTLSKQCFPENIFLAQLTAAQAILESGLGHAPPSQLALKYNNLFGIKGIGTGMNTDKGRINRINLPTHEWTPEHGMQEVDQMFAVNENVEDSLLQHKHLFDLPRYQNLKTADNFQEIATLIHSDGYATAPDYPSLLVSVYTEYGLENL